MSFYDYDQSRKLETDNYTFASLIMGAMRKADDFNLAQLKSSFPDILNELKERYNAPGGKLKGE
jgi:hypothetical protein